MVGTTPPVAGAEAVPAPAADFPATPSSVLSEARPEAPAAEPVAAEPVAAPAPEGEAPPPAPEALPLPTYEAFTVPEGIQINDDQLKSFTTILGETQNRLVSNPAEAQQAIQEMGQKMLELYAKETAEAGQRFSRLQHDNFMRTRESWVSEFRDDPQIGGNRSETTVERCGAMLTLYEQRVGADKAAKLREVLTMTGAGDNPEVLRFVNWAAGYAVEKPRIVAAIGTRAPQAGSKASRLYRNSIGNGAA